MSDALLDEIAAYLGSRDIDADDVERRLRTAWHSASNADQMTGRAWYANARAIATDLANETGFPVRTAIGVIAALSPQTDWERNIVNARTLLGLLACSRRIGAQGAHEVVRTQPTRTLEMAIEIARSESDPLDILTGPKRRAFYTNIFDPENPDVVTVDTHMVAIMTGCESARATRIVSAPHGKRFNGSGSYPWFAHQLKLAAGNHSIIPNAFQAVIWTARARAQGWYHSATSANGRAA